MSQVRATILLLCQVGDPILHREARRLEVNDIRLPEIQQLIVDIKQDTTVWAWRRRKLDNP